MDTFWCLMPGEGSAHHMGQDAAVAEGGFFGPYAIG